MKKVLILEDEVNIRRLRIKIEDDTANPTYITTVWGLGYKWGA